MRSLYFAIAVATMATESSAFSLERKRLSVIPDAVPAIKPKTDRRNFLSQAATLTAVGWGAGSGVLLPSPANAAAIDKVNARLKGYGLPPAQPLSSGFSPLLEVYGKGKNRFPLLLTFNHPSSWVVTFPSNNVNGEDGTIQAGEYNKGDTATFFLYDGEGHVDNISNQGKDLFERSLIKAISQKGDNIYQNFKVTKMVPQKYEGTSSDYMICDFRYELLTGAGFEVDRRGVAAVTSVGPAIEVLWAASTRQRYKTTEPLLREITSSFRVYQEGINFNDQIANYDDVM